MIGNDLVDLRAREAAGKSGDTRFLARVFTTREAELIASSPSPDTALWILWAAKEAAYKVAKKLSPDVIFAHSRYEVIPDDAALTIDSDGSSVSEGAPPGRSVPARSVLRAGRVRLQGLDGLDGVVLPVEWRLSPTFVHCVAMEADGDFHSLRVAISARAELDRDSTVYEPTDREQLSLAGRAAESLAVRRLARALAAEAGLGEVEIVRERHGSVFGPPRLYPRGGAAPLAGWDITLSHDGELAAVALANDGSGPES
ncbi:MAG TPA: 4'-phosphopantetheinyl transferase superfamily protein [Gemmatimonadaceae bacterium]|nr:4'-phosphopantetheinyl transferase superfamily protein [Gemmatimonadaceae bacterium]